MDFITKPFGWLMMFLYEFTKSYGLAVIIFALVVKIILLPFQMKSKRSMMKTSRLQPKMKELEKKHGANKQKYNEEVAKLYKEEHINPMSGCLWSLIPFPIIIALYSAIRQPLTTMMGVAQSLLNQGGSIYNKIVELNPPNLAALTNLKDGYIQIKQTEFISDPRYFDIFHQISPNLHQIDYGFLGMRLGDMPNWQFLWQTSWNDPKVWFPGLMLFLLPLVSGVLAYFSSKISMQMNPTPAAGQQQQGTTKTMMLMMPVISVFFGFSMPGAIGLYMIAMTVFSMIQDIYLTKHYTKIMDAEDAVKFEQQRIKEAELEAKRIETERRKLENKTEVNPNTSKKKQQKNERQEQLEKAADWEKKHTPAEKTEEDPSRSGTRRFARGRAYDPTRYGEETGTTDAAETAEESGTADETDTDSAASADEAAAVPTEEAVYDPENSSITFVDTDEEKE